MDHICAIVINAVFKKDFFPWKEDVICEALQLVHSEQTGETWLEEVRGGDKVVQRVRVTLKGMA